ncbi:MAG TPA: TPM domain-containing protein [Steroidobacteraceae bacterium]|jgi:uncharacterized membrane protein
MSTLARLLRHLCTTTLGTRHLFNGAVLAQIEAAIAAAESQHSGEIRFVVETALPERAVWQGLTPRQRAVQVFAHFRVWDTHHNNGVLIYVLRADRAVEILADRGISSKVREREWQAVCREVEGCYRAGRYAEGSSAAVAGVARLLGEHFPPGGSGSNELPNQPILL